MIPVEVERNPDDWSKDYGQDGKLVYVNKYTGERINSRLSPEEEALEILQRTKEAHDQAIIAAEHDPRMFFKLFTTDKIPFFVNMESGEAMWYLNPDVPSKCIKFVTHATDAGVPYYENVEKKTTSWTFPVDQMSSTARKNASSMKKLTKEQLEDKLNITQAEAMQRIQRLKRTGALSNVTRSVAPGTTPAPATASAALGSVLPPTHSGSPSTSKIERKSFKYNNIASVAASKPGAAVKSSSSGKGSALVKRTAVAPITAGASSKAVSATATKGTSSAGGAVKPLVRIIFERYDRAKDGFLDVSEMQDLFYDYGSFLSIQETQETIDQFDSTNTGSMQYIDFVAWWRNCNFFGEIELTEGDVRQRSAAADIFKRYDADRVGSISVEEYNSLHTELVKAGMTKASVDDCLKALQATSGNVEFIKFVGWLEKTRTQWEASPAMTNDRLSTFKAPGASSLKKLFGDLMVSSDDEPQFDKESSAQPTPVATITPKPAEATKMTETAFMSMFKRSPTPTSPRSEEVPVTNPSPAKVAPANLDPAMELYPPSQGYIHVSISKPLGISLGENVPNEASGVYVEECSPGGKADATGVIFPGLMLMSACGTDVQSYDFDSVMNILRTAPVEEPLLLVFWDPCFVPPAEEDIPAAIESVDAVPAQIDPVMAASPISSITNPAQNHVTSDDEDSTLYTSEDDRKDSSPSKFNPYPQGMGVETSNPLAAMHSQSNPLNVKAAAPKPIIRPEPVTKPREEVAPAQEEDEYGEEAVTQPAVFGVNYSDQSNSETEAKPKKTNTFLRKAMAANARNKEPSSSTTAASDTSNPLLALKSMTTADAASATALPRGTSFERPKAPPRRTPRVSMLAATPSKTGASNGPSTPSAGSYNQDDPFDEDADDDEADSQRRVAVIQSLDKNSSPMATKPVTPYSGNGSQTWTVMDPSLRERFGNVPVDMSLQGIVETDPIHISKNTRGCQTDYSAFIESEYQTSYQLLLGEKAELAAMLRHLRMEEDAHRVRLQRAEEEHFRRCQMREIEAAEAVAAEERRLSERIMGEERRIAEQQAILDRSWLEFRRTESALRAYMHDKTQELAAAANALAQHQKKISDDKKKVAKQRMNLDMSLREVNQLAHLIAAETSYYDDAAGFDPAYGNQNQYQQPSPSPQQVNSNRGVSASSPQTALLRNTRKALPVTGRGGEGVQTPNGQPANYRNL